VVYLSYHAMGGGREAFLEETNRPLERRGFIQSRKPNIAKIFKNLHHHKPSKKCAMEKYGNNYLLSI